VVHPTHRSGIGPAQRTQSCIVRSDQHGTRAEQFSITEQITERRNPCVIKATARLVENENVWRCGKRRDDRDSASLAIRKSPRRYIKQMSDSQASREYVRAGLVVSPD
jgi:hypothetical protein